MLIAALAAAFIFGACAGSFLGVVIHRMPRGLSIVRPPSRCGACGTQLATHDNIPILGWLLLRGRCRHCGTAIPVSCLYMELAVAVISTLVVWAALKLPALHSAWIYAAASSARDPGLAFWLPQLAAVAVLLVLAWLLIAEVLIDWSHLMIPDELTKGLQAVAIPLAVLVGTNLFWPWSPIVESAVCLTLQSVFGLNASFNADPQYWFRSWDVMNGWVGTPSKAAWTLGLVTAAALGLIALSLPLARRVYGRLKETWEERDHQAMAKGAWWFIGCTVLWTVPAIIFIATRDAGGFTNAYDTGLLLAYALTQAILGSLLGWWLPWTVGLVGTMAFKRNAMGYGDVKLFCGLGAFLGPVGTVVAFMFATIVGTLVGIPARLMGGGREMPFGPSLAAGAVLAVVLGPWLAPLVLGRLLG
jgi:leader peptidase (prepilin peptidase)/N-methyltransferase